MEMLYIVVTMLTGLTFVMVVIRNTPDSALWRLRGLVHITTQPLAFGNNVYFVLYLKL